MKRFTNAVMMLAGLLAWGSTAAAEELETREVLVTATRTEKDLAEIPMSVGVVAGGHADIFSF